ncbi:hypothetical protein DNU06_12715 [Putridiphycobacter roseus]|uniref:Uncharacterized protein n=1 Tax=Putridiphycobacter roseus TaxID=2219161 RepID=A0A2W1MWZ6_9FLAO|nr:hypothetical protein [Putridiphycobacter roseus]PZE16407.1 hypothetical protein DNU06_12715 [Putridiphycobacter roseus]
MEKSIGNRILVIDEKDNCKVIISPLKERWKEALLFAWLMAFTIIGFYMIYLLFFGMDSIDNSQIEGDITEVLRNQKIYLLVFVAFWMYFEFKVLKGFLWLWKGKELIQITKDEITIKHGIFSYGKANKYFIDNVKNFDLVEHKTFSFGFDYENAFWRQGTDALIFDANGKSIGFGKKLNEKDAKLLWRLLKDRIKKLAKS